ncbi:MAG: glycosyltransferase family 2 protein [Candidatus Bipolaricaulota bacterium]|nr:glycosyltransferase family 2 protein [Candidatus Bipolaricaulota bacterium]
MPAYNEAGRISAVLEPIAASQLVDEIIVVDDGSDDATAAEAEKHPVRVIRLPENRGKAAALDAGVSVARNDVFLFLDADLVGLKTEHVDQLIRAFIDGDLEMAVGVFSDGRRNTDLAQKINPYASGQRVLARSAAEAMGASQGERARDELRDRNRAVAAGGARGMAKGIREARRRDPRTERREARGCQRTSGSLPDVRRHDQVVVQEGVDEDRDWM